MNIIEAMRDDRFFRKTLQGRRTTWTWGAWETYLRALFGLPIESRAELDLLLKCTGLEVPPSTPARCSFVIAGRRSGKSTIAAMLACYVATFTNWRQVLSPGEQGHVFIIAVDKQQAQVIKGYVRAFLNGTPGLQKLVRNETMEKIALTNGANITVKTSSFRSVRGYTLLAAIVEELAFWRSEDSAAPDFETLAALRPALSTIPGSILIGISSPYSKSGALYDAFKNYYGKPDAGALIWKSASTTLNPCLDERIIAAALETDPEAARSEWLAEFRTDISAFIPTELVEAVTIPGRLQLPKVEGIRYHAHADPSGGRQDSFTLALAHLGAEGRVVLDILLERRPPFNPEEVVAEFSEVLKSYSVGSVTGDQYAGAWVSESFKKNGILYQPAAKSTSENFLDLLPLITSGSVELLDHPRLKSQMAGLERRVRSGGRDLVSHYPGGHDDLCAAVAGAVVLASINRPKRKGRIFIEGMGWSSPDQAPGVPATVPPRPGLRGRVFFSVEPAVEEEPLSERLRAFLRRQRKGTDDDD